MNDGSFDLNIERILENWTVPHAIREIIANALDEQVLSNTAPVRIESRGDAWIVRDLGRGLRYNHLTQNENQEKLSSSKVIGRFGIGLKDALATFERHNIKVSIRSRFGAFSTTRAGKHGFMDIQTLHAVIAPGMGDDFAGTEVEMVGVSLDDMESAKAMFLQFTDARVLDSTRYGDIVECSPGSACIYVNGVRVAEESNFLFSYNLTVLNSQIRKALNRERTNVGRTAYSDSVKKILLASKAHGVVQVIANDLANLQTGLMHDELQWVDVQEHAVRNLSAHSKIVLVTASEAMASPDLIDQAKSGGASVLTIPENLRQKIAGGVDVQGKPLVDLTQFVSDYNDSYSFDFVDRIALTPHEQTTFDYTQEIVELSGGKPVKVQQIRISNTMRPDLMTGAKVLGCWDPRTSSIVVWRQTLKDLATYAGVLVHELAHARTGMPDVSRDFESALTEHIGVLCTHILTHKHQAIHQGKAPESVNQEAQPPRQEAEVSKEALSSIYDLRGKLASSHSRVSSLERERDALHAKLAESIDSQGDLHRKLGQETRRADQAAAEAKALKQQLEARDETNGLDGGQMRSSAGKPWYRFW